MSGDVTDGFDALRAARWEDARALLETAAAGGESSPELFDGLAEARWWCGDLKAALAARERAVSGWHSRGEVYYAARAAVWLAIEYANGVGHEPAARGWLARASTLAGESEAPANARGWVALGHAALDADPTVQLHAAERALRLGRRASDIELEVSALARLGWSRIVMGAVDDGIALFDEAMATATAGDFDRLSTLGDLCCQLVRATEAAGERGRLGQWLSVVQAFNRDHRYPPLVAFCATCCAELQSGDGNWRNAEQHLRSAIDQLRGTGHRARCGPPAAKLAEMLILQGRVEEAADVLSGDESESSLVARARLALAQGEPGAARVLADRWVRRRGDDLLAVGALAVEGQAALAEGDHPGAAVIAGRIAAIAERTGNRRAAGTAALLEGEIALAAGDVGGAASVLERALDHYAGLDGLLEVARVHLALATARANRPELARLEATAALSGFEAAGATRLADVARGLLRALGDRRHVGRKGGGLLTDRELEILRLVARGLTNAEIAARLFISVKTAGNHVSSILSKIGARSRTEAAAFAALHPEVLAHSD